MVKPGYVVTKERHIKELIERVPPILNVDIALYKSDLDASYMQGKYLVGQKLDEKVSSASDKNKMVNIWLFPGGRVSYDETPQQAAERILAREVPGVKARLRKVAAIVSDKGYDVRAFGITITFLFEYLSGTPKKSPVFDKFTWANAEEMKKIDGMYDLNISILNELDATVRSMNTSQDELLVEVDKKDKEIGAIIKRDAHSNPKRFHRAAHIMIFNTRGEVVLQQRSLTKATGAGKWDMPGGHQVIGQTMEQTARQELAEEMGIQIPLTLQRIGLKQDDKQSEYYYLYYGISDGPFGFDRNEVIQVKAFDCQKLLEHRYDKEYSILAHVYSYTEELSFVWKKLNKNNK